MNPHFSFADICFLFELHPAFMLYLWGNFNNVIYFLPTCTTSQSGSVILPHNILYCFCWSCMRYTACHCHVWFPVVLQYLVHIWAFRTHAKISLKWTEYWWKGVCLCVYGYLTEHKWAFRTVLSYIFLPVFWKQRCYDSPNPQFNSAWGCRS